MRSTAAGEAEFTAEHHERAAAMNLTDLCFAGATEQAKAVRERMISARELLAATLARIDALNPALNAFRVVLADEALAEADRIDRARGHDDRPLLGVPVAIKDDVDVAGQVTAWGSSAHGDAKEVDSDVVARLRAAGAIVIGKTSVPELTLWPWTSSAAWGVTANPWDRKRTPGGSSGGSAAAVATGMCGVALGSDGGGSIRYPAALTGLFGMKTQRGRISLGPNHHDAWHGLTVYGPLTRTVADAALFLDATADDRPADGFVASLRQALPRLRIAVSYKAPPGAFARLQAEQRRAVEQTAELLRGLGHAVFEEEVTYSVHAARNVAIRYLKGLQHDITTVAHPERLESNTRKLHAVARRIPARSLLAARHKERVIAGRVNEIFERADVVLTPATGGPAPRLSDVDGHGVIASFANTRNAAWLGVWNAIGQPAASVPVGFDTAGLPLAVQLGGRPHDEATLLALAAELEEAQPWNQRRPPCPELS